MSELATGKKKYGAAVKFAVLTLILVQNTQAMCSPTLAAIQAAFPEADVTVVQMVNTIPAIVMIVSSAVCGPLSRKMGYKWAGLLGMAFALVGGIMPAIYHPSIVAVVVERAVFGVGYGMVFAMAIAACGDFWRGKETTTMVGLVTAFAGVGGIVYSLIAGWLTDISWTAPYWFYAIIILWAAYYAVFMPNYSELPKESFAPAGIGGKKKFSLAGFGSKYWAFLAVTTVCIGTMTAFINNAAICIVGLELGTGATVGLVMTGFSIGLMLGGFAYIPVYRALKRIALPCWMLLYGIMLLVTMLFPSLPMFFACAFLCGIAFGTINAAWSDMANKKVVDPHRSADGSSFYVAMQGVGQFIAPFWLAGVAAVAGLTSGNLFYQWYPAIAILIVSAVVLIVLAVVNKNKVEYERDEPVGEPDQADDLQQAAV